MSKLEGGIGFDRPHEVIGHADRHVEIIQLTTLLLGRNELHDVGMRDVQNRHLCPTPATGRFHRLARAIEHPHIGYRARSAAAGSLDQSRSEEHTSELQSLMRISYAVFCLKKTKQHPPT